MAEKQKARPWEETHFKGASYVQNHPSCLSHQEMLCSFPLSQWHADIWLMAAPEGYRPSPFDVCVCSKAEQPVDQCNVEPHFKKYHPAGTPNLRATALAVCRPSQCHLWQQEITDTALSGLAADQQMSMHPNLGVLCGETCFFELIVLRFSLHRCC